MDATRDDHTKESNSERERQILYNITYMQNLNYDTNEHVYRTEADSQTQRTTRGCQGVEGQGREVLGVWHEQTQPIICRGWIDNQILLHSIRNLFNILLKIIKEKMKKNIHV